MKILSKVILFSFLTLNVLCQNADAPRLTDVFGIINSESLTVSMYHFSDELKKNPDAKGYIVIYRSKNLPFGFPLRFGVKLQNYLVKNLELSQERFEIINGGLREELKTELWISSDKSKPPLADSIVDKLDLNTTALFDSFNYPTLYDGAGCCSIDGYTEESKKASLDKFAQQLKEQSTAKAYLVFYGQYCTDCSGSARYSRSGKYLGVKPDIYLDSLRTITRVLRKEKIYLHKNHGIDNSKITTINGGYRKWQALEFWIVPKGGEIPKPKPETFPKKKKRKK